jgi:FAD/FMN-containing dehydrogenase
MAATALELDTSMLETRFRGELVRPDDARFDEYRSLYNASVDKRPALIARATDVADVMAAVDFARESGAELAVRGGGHNVAGFGSVEGGIMLHLGALRGTRVDPASRLVTVAGGCTWGDVDHATYPFGLAVPGGVVSTTGVGGLTLGGGLGHLTRSCGLSIDNLVSTDVVLADGSFVTASEDGNEDLFWALRGGGGNFGVVTSFTFRAHPAHAHIAGPTLWPIEQATEAMRVYRERMADAPERLTGIFAFLVVPPGPPFPEELHLTTMCGVVWCDRGTEEEAAADLAGVRSALPPAFDLVGPIPHPILNGMFDGIAFFGKHDYWRADFVRELSDEAIETYVDYGAKTPNPFSAIHLYPVDGVAARVADDATAWNYRDAKWAQVIFAGDVDPAEFDGLRTWVVDSWEATHPYSAGGSYVNFLGDEGEDRVKAAYGDNYARLAEIKRRYDPDNFFHLNQNIKPAD